jgi:RimJ/RimL family protein N-acetyltransferase
MRNRGECDISAIVQPAAAQQPASLLPRHTAHGMRALHTDLLVLEPLRPEHAQEMFDILRDGALYEFIDDTPPASVQALHDRYERLSRRRSGDGRDLWLNWVLCRRAAGLAGYVQATVKPDHRAFVAYVIARDCWGQGIAGEAVQVMLAELKASYAVRQFVATVDARNARSLRLLQRLGFAAAIEAASGNELVLVRDA